MYASFKVLVVMLVLALLPGCREQQLYSGLAQRDANEMMALLKRSGVDASLALEARGGTHALSVPRAQAVAAVEVLTRSGLPRQKTPSMSELLPKDAWMLSPGEERAKLAYALSQEMTGTLRQLSGVSDVRVHVASADRNALGQVTAPATASVFLRYDPDVIGPDMADRIRSLVANSVSGLSYDKVSVLMVPQQDPNLTVARAGLPSLVPAAAAGTLPGAAPAVPSSAVPSAVTPPSGPLANLGAGAVTTSWWLAAIALATLFAAVVLRLLRGRA